MLHAGTQRDHIRYATFNTRFPATGILAALCIEKIDTTISTNIGIETGIKFVTGFQIDSRHGCLIVARDSTGFQIVPNKPICAITAKGFSPLRASFTCRSIPVQSRIPAIAQKINTSRDLLKTGNSGIARIKVNVTTDGSLDPRQITADTQSQVRTQVVVLIIKQEAHIQEV